MFKIFYTSAFNIMILDLIIIQQQTINEKHKSIKEFKKNIVKMTELFHKIKMDKILIDNLLPPILSDVINNNNELDLKKVKTTKNKFLNDSFIIHPCFFSILILLEPKLQNLNSNNIIYYFLKCNIIEDFEQLKNNIINNPQIY